MLQDDLALVHHDGPGAKCIDEVYVVKVIALPNTPSTNVTAHVSKNFPELGTDPGSVLVQVCGFEM